MNTYPLECTSFFLLLFCLGLENRELSFVLLSASFLTAIFHESRLTICSLNTNLILGHYFSRCNQWTLSVKTTWKAVQKADFLPFPWDNQSRFKGECVFYKHSTETYSYFIAEFIFFSNYFAKNGLNKELMSSMINGLIKQQKI